MLGGIGGRRRRGWQRMKWLDGITDSVDMSVSEVWELVMERGAWCAAIHGATKSRTWLSNWTELNWLMQLLRKGINGSQETILAQPGTCYSRLASFPFLTGEIIFCHRNRVNAKCKWDLWCQLYTRQSTQLVLYSLIKFLCKPLHELLAKNQIWGSWQ